MQNTCNVCAEKERKEQIAQELAIFEKNARLASEYLNRSGVWARFYQSARVTKEVLEALCEKMGKPFEQYIPYKVSSRLTLYVYSESTHAPETMRFTYDTEILGKLSVIVQIENELHEFGDPDRPHTTKTLQKPTKVIAVENANFVEVTHILTPEFIEDLLLYCEEEICNQDLF